MKKRLIWIGVPLILVLQGCASLQGRAENSWETVSIASQAQLEPESNGYLGMEDIGVVVLSEADGSPENHIDNAWQVLRTHADYPQARSELGKVLYNDPDNSSVQSLYSQISAPLDDYAKQQSFDMNAEKVVYLAKQGDNVEQLSERFYGTSSYFPFLMRVNKLAGASLSGGESLWIPAKLGASNALRKSMEELKQKKAVAKKVVEPVVVDKDVAEEQVEKEIVEAQSEPELSNQDESVANIQSEPKDAEIADAGTDTLQDVPDTNAVAIAEDEAESSSATPQVEAMQDADSDVLEVTDENETTISDENLPIVANEISAKKGQDTQVVDVEEQLNEVVEEEEALEEVNVKKSKDSELNEEKTLLSKEEEKGLSVLRKGDSIWAYSLLLSAPNLSEAGSEALAQLQYELVEKPYANGLAYYQQQKLEPAIAEFKRVLKANPNHGQARLYLARCQKLLERLQTIN